MSLQSRAGDTPLLAMFAHGNVVILQSKASGKTLRIHKHGKVEGIGGWGTHAQFTVHVRRPGVIALQCVHSPESWLAIRDGRTIGTGQGGPYCEFLVIEVEGTFVALESTMCPGQHVGILPGGRVKEPHKTKTGLHGCFIPSVHKMAPTLSPAPQVRGMLLSRFMEGSVLLLQSHAGGKYLRIFQGSIQGIGGTGQHAQFRVHVRQPGMVALECVGSPGQFVAIKGGQTTIGTGGKFCDLNVKEVGQYICLESAQFPGQHVGVRQDSTVKPAIETGTGAHGQFLPKVHSIPSTVVTPKNIFFSSSTTAPNSFKFGLVNIDDDSGKVYVTNDYSSLDLRDVYEDKGGQQQSNHFRIYFFKKHQKLYLTFQLNVAVYEVMSKIDKGQYFSWEGDGYPLKWVAPSNKEVPVCVSNESFGRTKDLHELITDDDGSSFSAVCDIRDATSRASH